MQGDGENCIKHPKMGYFWDKALFPTIACSGVQMETGEKILDFYLIRLIGVNHQKEQIKKNRLPSLNFCC